MEGIGNMLESCSNCEGINCLKVKDGVYMRKDNGKSPEIINGKVEDCSRRVQNPIIDLEETDKWFKLDGKVDTIHLGS